VVREESLGSAVVHEIKEPAGMSLSPESANSGTDRTERSKSELIFIYSLQMDSICIEAEKTCETGFHKAGDRWGEAPDNSRNPLPQAMLRENSQIFLGIGADAEWRREARVGLTPGFVLAVR
jgi:hypothetical protein